MKEREPDELIAYLERRFHRKLTVQRLLSECALGFANYAACKGASLPLDGSPEPDSMPKT